MILSATPSCITILSTSSSACGGFRSPRDVKIVIEALTADYREPYAGARRRLSKVLEVMLYAYTAAELRQTAENLMSDFD